MKAGVQVTLAGVSNSHRRALEAALNNPSRQIKGVKLKPCLAQEDLMQALEKALIKPSKRGRK